MVTPPLELSAYLYLVAEFPEKTRYQALPSFGVWISTLSGSFLQHDFL